MNRYQVILRPIITEKAVAQKEPAEGAPKTAGAVLCFQVHRDANKTEIRQAVEQLFKVKVADVRTSVFEGKLRRRGRYSGYRPDWKKAYVRLKPGQKTPDYAEI
jgi:large subunit ribosomal protein L23